MPKDSGPTLPHGFALRAIANLAEPERSQRAAEAESLYARNLQLAETERIFGAEIELLNQHGQIRR